MTTENNIIFSINEECVQNENLNFNINEFLNEIENEELQQDLMVPNIIHYTENYTIKELLVICDYYGIKANKCKKEIIVQVLVDFESNAENYDIVSKRKNLWFYISELKNDKFMKKYLLW